MAWNIRRAARHASGWFAFLWVIGSALTAYSKKNEYRSLWVRRGFQTRLAAIALVLTCAPEYFLSNKKIAASNPLVFAPYLRSATAPCTFFRIGEIAGGVVLRWNAKSKSN